MLDYQEKLKAMNEWLEDNIYEVEELCLYLDISVHDIVKCFPDKAVKAYKKTFPPDVDDNQEEEDEQEAWQGFTFEEEA